MVQITESELMRLGHEAAEHVAGPGTVGAVEVEAGEDSSDIPAYYFTFLVDRERFGQPAAVVYARTVQKLLGDLAARGDRHYPYIRLLDHADWPRRVSG